MRFEDKATLNIFARTSSSAFLLVSSVIMVRYLSKEDYGTFLQVMLVLNTIVMFAFVGLPQSVFYYYPQTRDKYQLVKQTLWLGVVISVVAALVVFLLRGKLAHWLNNPDLNYFGVFISLLILCQGPIAFRDPILVSHNALVLNSILTIISCLVDYLPIFIALYIGVELKGLMVVFLGSSVVNLLIFLVMIGYLLKSKEDMEIHENKKENQLHLRVSLLEQIKYSYPIGIASYIGILGKQIDKFIISALFLPAQFAVYSRGATEVPLINTITYTLNDMTMPRYVKSFKTGNIAEFIRLMHTNIDKVAKINFGVFIFLFIEGKLLMEILYTREYLDSTPIFQAYLFLLFLGITVYNMIPRVTGQTHQLTVATLLSVGLNVGFSLALIPIFGPLGVAIGCVVGAFAYMMYLLICAMKALGVGWRAIMPWKNLGMTFAMALLGGLVLWGYHVGLALLGVSANVWVLCCAFPVYTYGYLAAMNLVGLIFQEDRDYLKRWLRFNLFAFLPKEREW